MPVLVAGIRDEQRANHLVFAHSFRLEGRVKPDRGGEGPGSVVERASIDAVSDENLTFAGVIGLSDEAFLF
ncbi:MAG TPA: hypothetical protein PLB34_13345, partial [Rhodoblastus sp.]|nr:hypothetical protein [Rhodoblastus sp.]